MLNNRLFLIFLITIFLSGCAKISSPTGGPRDLIPPVPLTSVPENGARNFTGKKIVIPFDEFVILDNISEKFMVSPPMKNKPEVLIRGKNVNVVFQDDLRDSTTYTLNFQDAIRDLNENNVLDNYQFVFSTWKVIDSLSVKGQVFNAFNLNVPENTMVLLYRNLSDTAVRKTLPDYISRVDKQGIFSINNIRPGTYNLFALKDADNSKNYNQIEEEFAFLDSGIVVTPEKNYFPPLKEVKPRTLPSGVRLPTTRPVMPVEKPVAVILPDSGVLKGYNLILFAAEKTAHYLTSSDRKFPYQLTYTLSLPPDSIGFEFSIPGSTDESYFIEKSKNRDSIIVWLTDTSLYSKPQISTLVRYPFTDSTGVLTSKEDTVLMRFLKPRQTRGTVKKTPLQLKTNLTGAPVKPGFQITINSSTPLREPDTSRIRLYEVVDEKKQKLLPFELYRDTVSYGIYRIKATLAEGKKYFYLSDSAAFRNIYGDVSDSTGINFSVAEANTFGELTMNITDVRTPMMIQLLDQSEKMIREEYITKRGKVVFPLLDKGMYRLRAIFDLNGDRAWTTGDYDRKRQPEPVIYYSNEIEMRTDWKVENDWSPEIKNFKEQKFRVIKKQ